MLMNSRFGGHSSPDVEAEVFDAEKKNITSKFGDLSFVTPIQLVNLLYVVSNLR